MTRLNRLHLPGQLLGASNRGGQRAMHDFREPPSGEGAGCVALIQAALQMMAKQFTLPPHLRQQRCGVRNG